MKLLVVEDDPTLQQALLRLLGQWGYAAEAAATAGEALAWLKRELFDLVLLDLGLPDADGLALCQRLRRTTLHQPLVLMLTARDSSASKVAGLESGADDYVVKPFEPDVLRARLRALLRRAQRPLQVELSCGPLRLLPGERSVLVQDQPMELTQKEVLLLEQLLRLFTNLLDNAIRHSPGGGTVRMEVTPCGRQVQVAVIDQGPGIPAQQQEQVFLRFWRGADRGGHSGLGLAIARAIARRHGGELRVSESRQGRCVLLVELPTDIATS